MELFYWIIIVIAFLLFIGVMIWMGMMMTKSDAISAVYPPVVTKCPDNWVIDTTMGNNVCIIPDPSYTISPTNLGELTFTDYNSIPGYSMNITGQYNTIDFGTSNYASTCALKQWANKNNVVWDTVTNYNGGC